VREEFDIAGRRWVIEHVREVNPTQLARLRVLGVVCQTIPLTHIWLRGAPYVNQPDKANRAVPHQAFLQHGIPLAMGTDNKPYNPFHTLWAAVVRRERRSGAVIGPEHRLTRAQALRAFTMGGAYLCGQEELRGSLEAGKLADLAVLSDDPLQVPEESLPDIHAHLTIVGGRVVYHSGMLDT
jgi:predicted amidohydrolase YtcJ